MMSFDVTKRWYFTFFIYFFIPCFVYAFSIDENVLSKDMEYRAVKLFKATRCLVCSGESLYESKSSFAKEMREFVRGKIKSGTTDEEILRDLKKLYGEQILVNISYRGYANLLWIVPLSIAIATLIAMLVKLSAVMKKKGE